MTHIANSSRVHRQHQRRTAWLQLPVWTANVAAKPPSCPRRLRKLHDPGSTATSLTVTRFHASAWKRPDAEYAVPTHGGHAAIRWPTEHVRGGPDAETIHAAASCRPTGRWPGVAGPALANPASSSSAAAAATAVVEPLAAATIIAIATDLFHLQKQLVNAAGTHGAFNVLSRSSLLHSQPTMTF